MNPNIVRKIVDEGAKPSVFNISRLTKLNTNFRTVLWTGNHMQITLMSILTRSDIGLEIHHETDQFLKIEQGYALIKMGSCKENLEYETRAQSGYSILIPAETWHNIINIGRVPLKLYSIYSPPVHPLGAIHKAKEIARSEEINQQETTC